MNILQSAQHILGTRSNLCVRLARTPGEISVAQKLRFAVFYREMGAKAGAAAAEHQQDSDRFDGFCDHLVVVNQAKPQSCAAFHLEDGEMVGTYRLLRQDVAERHGGFYTQGEFDIAPLLTSKKHLNFLELGRSCVLKPFRIKPVVELLWQGIWNYVRHHGMDVMLGCASLEGADASKHKATLDFLARNCSAPPEWNVKALPEHYVEMLSAERSPLEAKAALKQLPPLIKGYLRLGCHIGQGAVLDHQFNTTDVLIILPVSNISQRYFNHFGQPGS